MKRSRKGAKSRRILLSSERAWTVFDEKNTFSSNNLSVLLRDLRGEETSVTIRVNPCPIQLRLKN